MSGHLLSIADQHMGKTASRRYVDAFLQRIGGPRPAGIDTQMKLGKAVATIAELQEQVRRTGYPETWGTLVDNNDPWFGGGISFATTSKALTFKTQRGNHTIEVPGPGRVAPVERELADDILHFRREACAYSDEPGLVGTCRAYRAYVFACVSLVECFLNRYVVVLDDSDPKKAKLHEGRYLGERIKGWLKHHAGASDADITYFTAASKAWSDFARLVSARNHIIHANEMWYGDELREVAKDLNRVNAGVGNLLGRMRDVEGTPPLGFIERLRSAPKVSTNW